MQVREAVPSYFKMSIPEFNGHETASLEQLRLQEYQAALDGFRQEEANLSDNVEAEWQHVPPTVRHWLTDTNNCPTKHIAGARQVFLDYVVLDASLAELRTGDLDDFMNLCLIEASKIPQLDKDISDTQYETNILKDINARAEEQNLKGRAALKFAELYINDPALEIPDTVREKLRARLKDTQAAVTKILAVTDDPEEQAAIAQFIDKGSLNLSGENRHAVFADVMTEIEASEDISKETKAKIKAEVMGVPPLRNATTTLNTLAAIRANNGRFLNANGEVTTFDEHNGVALDRYTIFPNPKNPSGYIATIMVGGRELRLPFDQGADPGYLNSLVRAGGAAAIFANRDLQTPTQFILGYDGLAAQGYQEVRLDMVQVTAANELYEAFMGFGVAAQTDFPKPAELNTFERYLQATHPAEDFNTGDNTGLGDKGWEQLGMIKDGKLNLERVREIGGYIRQNYSSLPSFELLVSLFGNKTRGRE